MPPQAFIPGYPLTAVDNMINPISATIFKGILP